MTKPAPIVVEWVVWRLLMLAFIIVWPYLLILDAISRR